VTAVFERDRTEQQERDLLNLSSRLLNDRAGFLDFATETNALLARIADTHADGLTLKRDLHTMKGNSAIFGLSSLATLCHGLESELEAGVEADALDRSSLLAQWESVCSKTRQLLGERATTALEIDEREYSAVLSAVRAGCDSASLERMLTAWRLEPLRVRLERAAEQLAAVAARAGKGSPTIAVDAASVYLARDELSEFWSVFAHVVRNGVTHGLDRVGERRAGQTPANDFELRAGVLDGALFVELEDRGPGIDWDTIRLRAQQRGLPASTHTDLLDAMFADGVSAESELTEFSGRGVGLSAVRDACLRQHGKIDVATSKGRGTKFRFSWPTSQFKSLIQFDMGSAP
jgi:two-component system chemotaxis sensor kinase CheA